MREIKFRGYDNKLKKYVDTGEIIFSFYGDTRVQVMPNEINYGQIADYEHDINNGRFIIEQYTGLIDEKGVQVFEGDIVECYGEDNEVILVAEVQFQEGGFCVQIDYDLQLIPLDTFGSAYKVIGNIHESQT